MTSSHSVTVPQVLPAAGQTLTPLNDTTLRLVGSTVAWPKVPSGFVIFTVQSVDTSTLPPVTPQDDTLEHGMAIRAGEATRNAKERPVDRVLSNFMAVVVGTEQACSTGRSRELGLGDGPESI